MSMLLGGRICKRLYPLLLCSLSPTLPAAEPAALGSAQQCAEYSGLPAQWSKDAHAGMVYLTGGGFTLGTNLGYAEERQEVQTQLDGFWIDQTEVTVGQFATFVKATGYVSEAEREGGGVVFHTPSAAELEQHAYAWWRYQAGADWRHPDAGLNPAPDNHPVTLVTLNDALAYAHWLGRDLPTEVEWEYAAKYANQGKNQEQEPRDHQGKPLANFWQGRFPQHNNQEDGHAGLAPVGCYPANPAQLYDMIGNAWEQTKDIYTAAHQSPPPPIFSGNAIKPAQAMVVKGGSHLCSRDFCVRYRPSAREAHEANLPIAHIGFRTVLRERGE